MPAKLVLCVCNVNWYVVRLWVLWILPLCIGDFISAYLKIYFTQRMYDVHQLHLMLFLFHSEEAAGFYSSFVLYYK